jgi:hypothetical protein
MNSQTSRRATSALILPFRGAGCSFVIELATMVAAGALSIFLWKAAIAAQDAQLSPIQVSPEKRQLIGLQFATVELRELKDRIQTTAFVEPDEQQEGYVQTRFPGWIRNVFVNQTYQYVRRGQPLFTIYSPDLVSAEQEYGVFCISPRKPAFQP